MPAVENMLAKQKMVSKTFGDSEAMRRWTGHACAVVRASSLRTGKNLRGSVSHRHTETQKRFVVHKPEMVNIHTVKLHQALPSLGHGSRVSDSWLACVLNVDQTVPRTHAALDLCTVTPHQTTEGYNFRTNNKKGYTFTPGQVLDNVAILQHKLIVKMSDWRSARKFLLRDLSPVGLE